MLEEFLARATNPAQYDFDDVCWTGETGMDSPLGRFFFHYLIKYKSSWIGSEILDVGCGTGWLIPLLKENGASFVEGIDPSRRNVQCARNLLTDAKVHLCDLASFSTNRVYDLLISVMVFGHIGNLDAAFEKISKLMKPNGEVQLIVPDYDYFKKERKGCMVEFAEINENEYVVQVTRSQGKIADIVRKNVLYENAAEKIGLTLREEVPMPPTEDFIKNSPRFAAFRNQPIVHLLRFY